MEDKKISCCDCKKEFTWTTKEQQFFKDNKIDKEPIRCRECAIILRDKRKKEAETKKQEAKKDQQSVIQKEETKTNKKSEKPSEN